ncbi:MAG: hypothetical protein JNK05_13800 [Myxococcales bacterium]|nr:hypothetical protein [Myxococcales bacterium]
MRFHALALLSLAGSFTGCFVGGGTPPDAQRPDSASPVDRTEPPADSAAPEDATTTTDAPVAMDVTAQDTRASTDTGVVRDVQVADVRSDTGAGSSDGGGCVGRLFCDDFERGTAGSAPSAPWRVNTNMGTVTVSTTRARSGTRSVRVTTASAAYKSAMMYIDGAPVFPVTGNVVFGRMMFYMDRAANDGVHWTMIEGRGPLESRMGVTSIYRYGGQHMQRLMSNYETSGARTDCWDHSATAIPQGRWACMEWRFDGPRNAMQFWLDGRELTDIATTMRGEGCIGHDLGDDWLAPRFQRMAVGWESYQMDDAREAFIDDVVFDDERIGCP